MSPETVLGFEALDPRQVALVGGKGAHLAELSRLNGLRVPPGFCVTTDAFRAVLAHASLEELLARLERLRLEDADAIRSASAELRQAIEAIPIPESLAADITRRLEPHVAYAVRSSATAEDSPTASFAGQQDTYLNVIGPAAVLEHVRRCWASLFTERAVLYRLRNGFDHRKVQMAVVVQRMVFPKASGILFTADPVTGSRRVASVDAGFGLGEALVSGLVNADVYKVRDGELLSKTLATKRLAITASPSGGTQRQELRPEQQQQPALTDAQVVQLEQLSRRIEAHFGCPQDIEWCLTDEGFHILQSRPITTLFPLPEVRDQERHVYVSVGHQQMMTDAMKDAAIVPELMTRTHASLAALKREIQGKSGPALFDFILSDLQVLKQLLFDPKSHQLIWAAVDATSWLNEHLQDWLGEKNAADTLTQSVPHNVTSEMGLALLDVADVVRRHPDAVALLERAQDDTFLAQLPDEPRAALQAWLDTYGMRCDGEIDITRPRWSERPRALVPMLLGNVRNFAPGEGARRFEQGRQEAAKKEQEVLQRLRALPDGAKKAEETKRMIDRVRAFVGHREFPKYGMVSRYLLYKQALLAEAERLPLDDREDLFFLTFHELHEAVRTGRLDAALIQRRKDAFHAHQALTPPRVMTSEGEVLSGACRREGHPPGALVGLAVSAGSIEGRARVILDLAQARLEAGDILVTVYTDPSWTPLFVGLQGLVTEVGGLMTHGAVIAREYGLPAVVGVQGATRLIRDGQRIRVNGTDGYVELLA